MALLEGDTSWKALERESLNIAFASSPTFMPRVREEDFAVYFKYKYACVQLFNLAKERNRRTVRQPGVALSEKSRTWMASKSVLLFVLNRSLGSITYPVAQANSSPTTNIHVGRLYTKKPRKEAVQAHSLKLTSAWRSRALYTFPWSTVGTLKHSQCRETPELWFITKNTRWYALCWMQGHRCILHHPVDWFDTKSRWTLCRDTSNSPSYGVAYTLVNNTNEKTRKYSHGTWN